MASGECYAQRGGIKPFEKIVEPDAFYPCLREYLETDLGTLREKDLIFSDEEDETEQRVIAYKVSVDVKKIDSVATQGVDFLVDIRRLEEEYGLPGTYSYAQEYLDFEQYVVFTDETFLSCGLSVIAVVLVILFITASL